MASSQALLLGSLLVLAMAVGHSSAAWCVCKVGPDDVLQKTLDWACGHGADCSPLKESGSCYNPNSVRAHCSYAVNSYYQKTYQAGGTCDFSSTATITTTDPSSSGCSYPASASGSTTGTPTTPGVTPVSGTPGTGTTPTTSSPLFNGTTPSSGILGGGGVSTGLAPTGMGMNDEGGAVRMESTSLTLCLVVAGLVLQLWM